MNASKAHGADDGVQLQVRGIGKRYGSFEALREVDIDIHSGEFLTLLGPSGSGKTTLLMTLAGFTIPTSGRLIEGEIDITRRAPERRNFGMVFQGYSLFPHLTVADNVAFPLRIRKVAREERARQVKRMLEVVGLSEHGAKKPSALSGGQQQRVAIARALVFGPDVLLLDEPLSALDKNLREQLQAELKRIHREVGTTFVFVTHDQSEALSLSTRIAIFNEGEIAQIGDPESVYSAPDNRFVAEFLGRINLLPVTGVERDGTTARATFGTTPLTARAAPHIALADRMLVAVRPEHMGVHADRPAAADNAIHARVTDSVYHGATTTLTLDAGAGGPELTTTLMNNDSAFRLRAGDDVWLSWDGDKGILMADTP